MSLTLGTYVKIKGTVINHAVTTGELNPKYSYTKISSIDLEGYEGIKELVDVAKHESVNRDITRSFISKVTLSFSDNHDKYKILNMILQNLPRIVVDKVKKAIIDLQNECYKNKHRDFGDVYEIGISYADGIPVSISISYTYFIQNDCWTSTLYYDLFLAPTYLMSDEKAYFVFAPKWFVDMSDYDDEDHGTEYYSYFLVPDGNDKEKKEEYMKLRKELYLALNLSPVSYVKYLHGEEGIL